KSVPNSSALMTKPPPVAIWISTDAEMGGSSRLIVCPGAADSVTEKSHGWQPGVATHLPASASGTGSVGATSSLSPATAKAANNRSASARSLVSRGVIVQSPDHD